MMLRRVAFTLSSFCLLSVFASAQADQPKPERASKRFYSPADRVKAIREASIFQAREVAKANILEGPPQNAEQFQLHLNDKVVCDFVHDENKSGATPKFDCEIVQVEHPENGEVVTLTDRMDEEPVKVKFRPDNREIYAEVATTRLLWALGFHADAMYPVRLQCRNCPADPDKEKGPAALRSYPEAVIERKFPGRRMYEKGKKGQGWSWKEFENLNQRSVHQKDGLKMVASFLIHSDNKPEQQRLVCKGVKVDQSVNPFSTTCRQSKMLIQDVGATFGGGGRFTNRKTAKMNLESWSKKKVWKKTGSIGDPDPPECQAELLKSWAAKDGLKHPKISEEGRRFAAGLLCQLSDRQIEDLFRVARVAEMPEHRNGDGSFKPGLSERSVVARWVQVFKRKREELASGRCRWIDRPADLSEIENPMGLAEVPNFCSASPF